MANIHQMVARSAAAVTPDDEDVIAQTVALYVGGAGNLVVTMADGTDCTFLAVPVGTILPIAVTKVKNTSTTATNIVALRSV